MWMLSSRQSRDLLRWTSPRTSRKTMRSSISRSRAARSRLPRSESSSDISHIATNTYRTLTFAPCSFSRRSASWKTSATREKTGSTCGGMRVRDVHRAKSRSTKGASCRFGKRYSTSCGRWRTILARDRCNSTSFRIRPLIVPRPRRLSSMRIPASTCCPRWSRIVWILCSRRRHTPTGTTTPEPMRWSWSTLAVVTSVSSSCARRCSPARWRTGTNGRICGSITRYWAGRQIFTSLTTLSTRMDARTA